MQRYEDEDEDHQQNGEVKPQENKKKMTIFVEYNGESKALSMHLPPDNCYTHERRVPVQD